VKEGKKPVITFSFDPKLTKAVTLKLYRWILMSHLFLQYVKIQECYSSQGDINATLVKKILEDIADEKAKRR
jgi:hypothetical protein